MGCNCKQIKKMQSFLPNANKKQIEKKGFLGILHKMFNSMANIGLKIIFSIILIIAFPIVLAILIFNLFYDGKATVKVPKKALQAAINTDKN